VPGEGERAGDRRPGPFGGRGDPGDLVGAHAAAVLAAVHLDDELGAGPGQHRGEQVDRLDRVDADPQRDPLGQRPQPGRPRPDRPQRVGDEQVRDPARGEHLGLPHRGHGQPDGPAVELAAGDLQALVGLGVRAQGQALVPGERGGAVEVAVEQVEVDREVGGVEHPVILRDAPG
jgi:hypothetical protein